MRGEHLRAARTATRGRLRHGEPGKTFAVDPARSTFVPHPVLRQLE